MTENRFTIDGHDYFMKTSPKDLADAKKAHNKGFREALEDGALLRKGLIKYMREQGVWDDAKEEQYQIFVKRISELEFKLASGKMKVSEGREIAIELSKVRNEFRELISERNMMDANTAEGQADNARFNFLLVKSVYDYDTQKPVYASLDDYVQRGSEPLALALASKFANFFYGIDENYDKDLVENKFLRRFKLIDDQGRFLNKDGQFIDESGVLLDADGYRINSEGIRVDINGHPLDANVETAEFEED